MTTTTPGPWPLDFEVRDTKYALTVLDDGLTTDPTLLLFRGNETVAILTLHLDPNAECLDSGVYHVIAPAEPLEE